MTPLPPETAEALAIAALGWIASDPEIAGGFLGYSGASPDALRARATDPHFLGFVLDYLMLDDEMVIGFSRSAARPPEDVLRARAGLPGGDLPNWT